MKIKKIVALLMACVMLLALAGCSSSTGGTDSGEIEKIVFYFVGDADQPDKDEVYAKANELLRAQYGIEVEFNPVTMGTYNDKMNLIMASGEYYDVCWCSNWSNDYIANVGGGAYYPLDELLEKDAPAVKEIFNDNVWNGVKVQGKIYGVPIQQIFATSTGVLIPEEYYDEYAHYITDQPINSLDGFTPYMEAVSKLAPGKAKVNPAFTQLMPLYGWEAVVGANVCAIERKGDTENIKVFNYFETPEYRKAVETKKSWTDNGYTTSGMTVGQSVQQGPQTTPISILSYKPAVEIMNKPAGYDVKSIQLTDALLSTSGLHGSLYAISVNSKNPKASMKLIEALNTNAEIANLLTYGIEGKHYNKVGENIIKVVENPGFSNYNWCVGNIFNLYVTDNLPANIWEETKKMNDESSPSRILGFVMDKTPIAVELNNCNAVIKEYESMALSGLGDTSKTLEEMLAKLKQAGADRVVEEVQRQIDEFIKSK